jgi:hypothetical protein
MWALRGTRARGKAGALLYQTAVPLLVRSEKAPALMLSERVGSGWAESERVGSGWAESERAESGWAESERAESGWAESERAESERAESGWAESERAESGRVLSWSNGIGEPRPGCSTGRWPPVELRDQPARARIVSGSLGWHCQRRR